MTASVTDTHCHLSHCAGEPAEIVADARRAGVARLIDIGMGIEESLAAAQRTGDGVYASVGVHPNDLSDWKRDRSGTFSTLRELLSRPGVVAVGETGLDRYRDREDPMDQRRAFADHIELAHETDRTLVIHCREAHAEVLEVLEEVGPPPRVVMHCFSGDVEHARACADRGYWCSFAGNITYPRNSELREAARVLPRELLLVETDAPYLAPVPHRGKPNRPALVGVTADALAEVLGEDPPALRERVERNTEAAFLLPRPAANGGS
ncbi:MAG TPA: TatD family hydrolase [Actinomycetota bacterium]|nr:TatD family hydrolase [Actinomycetota bacterium]